MVGSSEIRLAKAYVMAGYHAEAGEILRSYSASDQDERIEWLCRSAMADAMCAIRDYAALIDLSVILFERGDVNRSFHYMADHCMPDAIAFGGKLRPWQIVRFFPEVEKAYEAESNLHNRRQIVLTIVISALLVLLALVLVALIIRQKALDRARRCLEQSYRELKESDNVKQTYIAGFLEHLSENINTSRQYKNHVRKFLRMGYIKDLEEDIEGFYKIFDETFINLYPGFVEKFNALLLPEEAITPKAGYLLTPELRVFALIKLGISDSSRIASLLHYSSNTIYNYRAKIKNKAIGDRDSFEDAVKSIN
jgi:hypothetical protein